MKSLNVPRRFLGTGVHVRPDGKLVFLEKCHTKVRKPNTSVPIR